MGCEVGCRVGLSEAPSPPLMWPIAPQLLHSRILSGPDAAPGSDRSLRPRHNRGQRRHPAGAKPIAAPLSSARSREPPCHPRRAVPVAGRLTVVDVARAVRDVLRVDVGAVHRACRVLSENLHPPRPLVSTERSAAGVPPPLELPLSAHK